MTGYQLAKSIGNYLTSQTAEATVAEAIKGAAMIDLDDDTSQHVFATKSMRVRARTARRWLGLMGFEFKENHKDVFFDGHERADVVAYRQDNFLPTWMAHEKRFAIFAEDGSWKPSLGSTIGHENLAQRPLILVTHDESTFHSNDGKRKTWGEKDKPKLKPKGRGRGIMPSGFLTPGGILPVSTSVTDEELLAIPHWPADSEKRPKREAIDLLEFGGEEWWTADKMIDRR